MPARKNKIHHDPGTVERIRGTIKALRIIERFNAFVLEEDLHGKPVELSNAQVAAGLGLLKKIVPDLSNTTLTDEDGAALPLAGIKVIFVRPEIELRGVSREAAMPLLASPV